MSGSQNEVTLILDKLSGLTTELHGLTIELKHDRQETADLRKQQGKDRDRIREIELKQRDLLMIKAMLIAIATSFLGVGGYVISRALTGG